MSNAGLLGPTMPAVRAGSRTARSPQMAVAGSQASNSSGRGDAAERNIGDLVRQVHQHQVLAAFDHHQTSLPVVVDVDPVEPRVAEVAALAAQPDQVAVPPEAAARAAPAGSSQSRRERSTVSGRLRVGHVGALPAVLGELVAPAASHGLGRARGSVWSVKYCHGVDAPHSSPMKSIGVTGAGQEQAPRRREQARAGAADSRSPVGTVADLVVGLQRHHEPRPRERRAVDRTPVRAAAERRVGAVVQEDALEHLRECARARRSRRSSPASRRSAATCRAWWTSSAHWASSPRPPASRGVTVSGSLRSDSAISHSGRPSRVAEASTSAESSSSRCDRAVVEQGVHGVEPQPVDVEVAQPHASRCR